MQVAAIGKGIQWTYKENGAAYNLTSATVTAYIQRPDGTQFKRVATIVDGPNGICKITTIAGDITLSGAYPTQLLIVNGGETFWSEIGTFYAGENITWTV